MTDIHVAFYNLENLFDHENAQRDPELKQRLRNELAGWTAAVRDRKLDQLARVIRAMFGGAGPDVLGVCEVENERVLGFLAERLDMPGRDYQVMGHASPDARGIDVSFLFDANRITFSNPMHQVVIRRNATRDLFWGTFTEVGSGASFMAIANHWPSRSGGQYESEPFRLLTGETASFVLSELTRDDDRSPVILMGDFNDEPFNRSMQEFLLGERDRERVTRARTPRVFNLMWPLMFGNDPGTYRFGSDWNMLDQFLITKGLLLQNSPLRVDPDSVEIFRPDFVRGSGGRPRRFGRPAMSSGVDSDGFSDHFPITVILRD